VYLSLFVFYVLHAYHLVLPQQLFFAARFTFFDDKSLKSYVQNVI